MASEIKDVTVVFNAYDSNDLGKSAQMLKKFAKQNKLVLYETRITRELRRQCISSIHGCDGEGLIHRTFHVSGEKNALLKLSLTSIKDGALMYIFPNT